MTTHTPVEVGRLLNLGLLAEGSTFIDMDMTAAVSKVLDTPAALKAVSVIANTSISDLKVSLEELLELLDTLPHDAPYVTQIILLTTMTSIAIIAVILRCYSRMKVTKKMWAEDRWAVASAVGTLILYALYILQIYLGGGTYHIWDTTFRRFKIGLAILMIAECGAIIALMIVKITFAVFYYRLSPDLWYQRSISATIMFSGGVSIVSVFVILFQCKPVDFWNYQLDPELKCINRVLLFSIGGALLMTSDILLLALPIFKVSNLNVHNTRQKVMALGMFAAGGLVCIASVLRTIYLNRVLSSTDSTYEISPVGFWSKLEIDLAILISCLPALKSLISDYNTNSTTFLASKIVRSKRIRRRQAESTLPVSTNHINNPNGSLDADNTWEEDKITKVARSTWCSNHTGPQKPPAIDEEMGGIEHVAEPQAVLKNQPSLIKEHSMPGS